MMIGVSKHFPWQMRALVEGQRPGDRTKLVGRDIAGKTLGIVGFGRIGRRVGAIARNGFGMDVLYNDIIAAPADVERLAGPRRASFEEILAASDYLTLHVPLDASTRRMIDGRALARLKPNAVLINTCRGPVVDEEAVAASLASKHLFGYGADVYTVEPPPADHPLIGRADFNVILTPHSAPLQGSLRRA